MTYDSRLDAIKHLRKYGYIDINETCILQYDRETNKFQIEKLNPDDLDMDHSEEWKDSIDIKGVLRNIRIHFERFPVLYVNAYAVSRHFGGHEEGGWWFDAGEPLASIPVRKGKDDMEAAEKNLKDIYGPEYEGNRPKKLCNWRRKFNDCN